MTSHLRNRSNTQVHRNNLPNKKRDVGTTFLRNDVSKMSMNIKSEKPNHFRVRTLIDSLAKFHDETWVPKLSEETDHYYINLMTGETNQVGVCNYRGGANRDYFWKWQYRYFYVDLTECPLSLEELSNLPEVPKEYIVEKEAIYYYPALCTPTYFNKRLLSNIASSLVEKSHYVLHLDMFAFPIYTKDFKIIALNKDIPFDTFDIREDGDGPMVEFNIEHFLGIDKPTNEDILHQLV